MPDQFRENSTDVPCPSPPSDERTVIRDVQVGRFWYHAAADRWEWSDELARLHGYPSLAAVNPTAEVILQHKHPDDRLAVSHLIERVRQQGAPFSSRHRIIDTRGRSLPVVVIADVMIDPQTGLRSGTAGFYIALTPTMSSPTRSSLGAGTDAGASAGGTGDVDALIRRRAVIEQAKGALMLVYRIDEHQAFDLLVWRSQETNTKLQPLAEAIGTRLTHFDTPEALRTQFDHLLLTAHEQVSRPGEPQPPAATSSL